MENYIWVAIGGALGTGGRYFVSGVIARLFGETFPWGTLLINVTEFFRDPDAFLFLRNSVLPDVIERGRTRGRSLRLWSAGCSTGDEA